MGQNCCAENKYDKSRSYMDSMDVSSTKLGKYEDRPSIRAHNTPDKENYSNRRNVQEVKLEKFMKRHKVNQLLYYSKGGLFESYICGAVSAGGRRNESSPEKKQTRNRLVQAIKIERGTQQKALEKIQQLQGLDSNRVEPVLEGFSSEGRVFIANRFIGQGYRDLYMLANIRGCLSED